MIEKLRDLPICIHGGMPKTGTTTLQVNVFPGLDGVLSLGKEFPNTAEARSWKAAIHQMTSVDTYLATDENEASSALTSYIETEIVERSAVLSSILFSVEGFYNPRRIDPTISFSRAISVLRKTGLSGPINIWITIREPTAFMWSQYRHVTKNRVAIPSQYQWVDKNYREWVTFDFIRKRDEIKNTAEINDIKMIKMEPLLSGDDVTLNAICSLLGLLEEDKKHLKYLIQRAPKIKAEADDIDYHLGRLEFELREKKGIAKLFLTLIRKSLKYQRSLRLRKGRQKEEGGKKKRIDDLRVEITGYNKLGNVT